MLLLNSSSICVFGSLESTCGGTVIESLIATDGAQRAAGTQPDTHAADVDSNILDGCDTGHIGR